MKKESEGREESMEIEEDKKLADQLFEDGKVEEALSHYRKVLELNPECAEVYCNVGLIHFGRGEFDEAEKNFLISLKKDENQIHAYFNIGCLYQSKNDFENALSFYKEVVLRSPDDAQTYLRMGICAQSLERKDDAQAFFEEAFRLQPNSIEVGAALSGLLIETGQYEKAEEVLKVSLVSHPDDVSLYFSLGLVLKEQKKFESALAQFNKVVSIDDKHSEGFYHLAECCIELGLLEQAEPFFAKAYKLNPTFSEPVLELGRLYNRLKNLDKAVIMYRQWVSMIEDKVWQFDEDMKETYKKICLLIADYYEGKGEDEEVSLFKEKAELLEESEIDESSGIKEKDYRVSLQIDD